MSSFKKGQLVAVNSPEEDDRQWRLRLYANQIGPDLHLTYNPDEESYDTWSLCRPAEKVWYNAFLECERRAVDQAIHAVAMKSELVQRLRRQIEWLCEELADDDSLCVDPSAIDLCDHECARCWEQASLKAVAKEGANG